MVHLKSPCLNDEFMMLALQHHRAFSFAAPAWRNLALSHPGNQDLHHRASAAPARYLLQERTSRHQPRQLTWKDSQSPGLDHARYSSLSCIHAQLALVHHPLGLMRPDSLQEECYSTSA